MACTLCVGRRYRIAMGRAQRFFVTLFYKDEWIISTGDIYVALARTYGFRGLITDALHFFMSKRREGASLLSKFHLFHFACIFMVVNIGCIARRKKIVLVLSFVFEIVASVCAIAAIASIEFLPMPTILDKRTILCTET